ncbi:MAG TPA: hypothetical protein VGL99_10425 [Chloroflexota bacterium]
MPVNDGGSLIHFLPDQQWVMHWLLYIGSDGAEAVLATYVPYGFALDESEIEPADDPSYKPARLREFQVGATDAVVCAESFSEFVYRYWIENEIFFRARQGRLPDELGRYAEHYAERPGHG